MKLNNNRTPDCVDKKRLIGIATAFYVRKGDLVAGFLVALAAFLVYANSLTNGFVWDDDVVIVANSALRGDALALFSGIDLARATDLNPYYRPLTLLSFLLEYRVHGLAPFLVRLFNVLLHCANAFLVYRLALSRIMNRSAALLAGLIFAVHPLQSEGVDFNAGGRNTMLAAFFILSTYMVHEHSVRLKRAFASLIGAGLFLAGLLSKEIALAILPFIVALEIDNLGRANPTSQRKAILRIVPYFASLGVYLILRNNALSLAGVSIDILSELGPRLVDNLYIIPRYLLTVLCPITQSSIYFVPEDINLLALPLAVTWVIILIAVYWLVTLGRNKTTIFGLAWLIMFWIPVSGILPIPSASLADRYMYVPAIGLWLIVASQVSPFLSGKNISCRWVVGIVSLALLSFSIMTIRRNMDWRSDITLFSRVVEQHPEQSFGYHNLGTAYLDKEKNLDLAERSFERALSIDPSFPRLRTQMGYVRLKRGDLEGALRHYNEAVMQNPHDAEALLNRGGVLEELGRNEEAIIDYRRFLATSGNEFPEARLRIGNKLLWRSP